MIYSPSEDSFLLQKEIAKCVSGKSFLDMGAGSGIQAETALNSEASKILAVDIDGVAVRALKKKGIDAIRSDLFSKVSGRYDVIAFNPPYLPEDKREDNESRIATSGGKKGDEVILRFLKYAGNYLNPNGIILLVVSSLTPLDRINRLISDLGFRKRKLASARFFMEKIEVWKIVER